MNWSGWTELKPFDNYCNIKSYVGHEGKTGSRKKNWHTTLEKEQGFLSMSEGCLLYTSPSPRDRTRSRMPSSA